MTQAESLAGAEVLVPEDELKPLTADTFYHHQILGCRVVTVDGRELGRVADIQSAAGSDLLVIRPGGREEILIPFSRNICREVNLEAGLIVIDPPDGLLDLNEI
jgi:16S rRNA processing protein RimM